jgi:hypothetical protein
VEEGVRFEAEYADRVEDVLDRYRDIERRVQGSSFEAEVKDRARAVEARLARRMADAELGLRDSVQRNMDERKFAEARRDAERALNRFRAEAWKASVGKIRESIEGRILGLVHDVQTEATLLMQLAKFAEARDAVERLRGTDLAELDQEAERLEASVRFRETKYRKDLEADKQAYQAGWDDTVKLVRRRSYAQALARLGELERGLKTEEVKGWVKADRDDVKRVEKVVARVGAIHRIDRMGVSEIAEAYRAIEESDVGAAFLFALFEGDLATAQSLSKSMAAAELRGKYMQMLRELEERRRDQ